MKNRIAKFVVRHTNLWWDIAISLLVTQIAWEIIKILQ